jgi:hypothetical protein
MVTTHVDAALRLTWRIGRVDSRHGARVQMHKAELARGVRLAW